jgi:polyhydroxyalkanoate synthesis repressor PhaR
LPEDDRPVSPIVVKKYANRRLYDTESSIYITLDTLADMVRQGRDFVVYDAKTGDDITRAVLTQIIMEEETKGRNMLPTSFLRQLIGFYGDSMQGLVPEYLERMMEQFAAQQSQARNSVQRTMQNFLPPGMEEVGRQNLQMMDRAMSLFTPFLRTGPESARPAGEGSPPGPPEAAESVRPLPEAEEILALREEVARLREELARATAGLAEPAVAARTARGGIRH